MLKEKILLRNFGILYDILADAVDEINSIFSKEVTHIEHMKGEKINILSLDDGGLPSGFDPGSFQYLYYHERFHSQLNAELLDLL